MFNPYKKDEKLLLNRLKLSCKSAKCMKFASKSAKLSFNSAKDGSKASSGRSDAPRKLALPDSRREDRDEGRRGVVGRERGLRVPEVDLFALLPASVWGVLEAILNG